MKNVLLTHAAATWALSGFVWAVQLVLYPLFAETGRGNFQAYHGRHMLRITFALTPLLAVEAITAIWLLIAGLRDPWFLGSLIPLAFIYVSTWIVQVPLHFRLGAGFDAAVLQRLITTNRWRTAAWILRGVCVAMALQAT
jgi:hypothetical protein